MKRILFISVFTFFMSLSILAQNTAFQSLQDMEGVEYISLDKDMLSELYKASSPDADVIKALDLAEELTVINIDKDEKKASKKASSILKKQTSHNFIKVVDADEDNEKINVFSRDLEESKKEYIISYEDEEDMIIFIVKGKLTAEEAKDMIKIEIK